MKIGYIQRYDLTLNPHLTERFKFREATCTRKINTRGDLVYAKSLQQCPVDYEEVKMNTKMMKQNDGLILVCEPFFLDDELREKCVRWVEWANQTDPKEYDPFYVDEEAEKND